jgi:tRNA threonylcarbamoyladenosine modification (KEOPS) complex  Pcc1 subunit
VVDFNRRGKPIGIEITAPSVVTLRALNRVLRDLGLPTLKRADLAPLLAA